MLKNDSSASEEKEFIHGELVGKIEHQTKQNREYVVYRYRWWHKNKVKAQHSKTFRIEDYNNDEEAAIRAAKEEQERFCEEYNLRINDYRIDGDTVAMKLCLYTANMPSASRARFDLADMELVQQKVWFHDETMGVVYRDKGRNSQRRTMAAYLHADGNIKKGSSRTFNFRDGDWMNNTRANFHRPVSAHISPNLMEIYSNLRHHEHTEIIGRDDKKHKRFRLNWTENRNKRQKCFYYGIQSPADAQLQARDFILRKVSGLLGERAEDESEDDVPRRGDGKLFDDEKYSWTDEQ